MDLLLLLIGIVALLAFVFYLYECILDRSRAQAERTMSPDEIRRKRALEDLADRLTP